MGAKGGSSPQPWTQHTLTTLFLRVPSTDWAAVTHGSKTEFRAAGTASLSRHWDIHVPTPVVAYTVRSGQHLSKLLVLTAVWREPLGAISAESLQREGFPEMAHFRRYWMSRTHRRFTPLTSVMVYRLAPFTPDVVAQLGVAMLTKLYKEHLPK